MRQTLTYVDQFDLSSAGVAAVQVFNLNSLFDPDRTGAGHQPRYFDQLAALYGRYRVDRAIVEVCVATAELHGVIVNLYASNDAGGLTPTSSLELPWNSGMYMCVPYTPCILRQEYNLRDIPAVSKSQYEGGDHYQALVSASPTEIITCSIGAEANDGAAGTTVYATIRVTFDVEFSDRIQVGAS